MTNEQKLTTYTQEAINHIASNDYQDLKLGGDCLKAIKELFTKADLGNTAYYQYVAIIEDEVSELRNPWFAHERVKIAIDSFSNRIIVGVS